MLQSSQLSDLVLGLAVLTPVLTVTGAYWSVRFGLNGTKKDVADIKASQTAGFAEVKSDLKELRQAQDKTSLSLGVCQANHARDQEWIREIDGRLNHHLEIPKP